MSTNACLRIASFVAAVCICSTAHAALSIVSTVGGQPPSGVNYVNFDDLPLGSTGGTTYNTANSANLFGSILVSLTPNAQVVTGSVSGQYAAPYLSNSNGVLFGDNTVSGPDTTRYITAGSTNATAGAKVELVFSAPQRYFGLLWGSVDTYNTLEFFSGNTLIGTITGAMVTPAATGNQGLSGTFYVNIDSAIGFDKVVATSSQFAFEFDNVAYSTNPIVPEPSSALVWSLICVTIGGSLWRRRRKSSP